MDTQHEYHLTAAIDDQGRRVVIIGITGTALRRLATEHGCGHVSALPGPPGEPMGTHVLFCFEGTDAQFGPAAELVLTNLATRRLGPPPHPPDAKPHRG